MSRLCVKNLPEYVVENRLRDFFSQKGEVTDVKLVRTKRGKSRRIAFVGFRTQGEAETAIKYFHNSYMDTSKISCQVALPIGDPNIPTPWSRYSKKKQEELNRGKNDISDAKRLAPSRPKEELKKSKKNTDCRDPKLQEFLQLMQPRSRSKLWANDTIGNLLDHKVGTALKETHSQQGGEKKTNNWSKGLIRCTTDLPSSENPLVRKHDELDEQENDSTVTHSAKRSHNLAQDELLSDMDYLKSRVKKEWSDSDSSEDGNDTPNKTEVACEMIVEKHHAERTSETPQAQAESVDPSQNLDSGMNGPGNLSPLQKNENNRLFVRNLPYTATEDDLSGLFQRFGNLSEVHLVVDKDTKMSKGYAYVLYALPESAVRALDELDKSIFQGRILHVMPAEQHNSSEKQMATAASQTSKSFKEYRVEHKKAAEASGDTRAWNSLFMRPDTVVENIARKYGVSKSDILDPEANDLAVRVALGETQVISDTKRALVSSGVNVVALEKIASGKADAISRSNHIILVKNLPYGTSEGDLAKMFGKFGSIDKIILPPTKTLALVVFLEAGECTAAFRGLSYKRYKDAPLYLERPPCDILSSNSKSENDAKDDNDKSVILEQQQRANGISDEDIDPDKVESRTLFVKNLNFKTTDECLRNHLSLNMKEGSIRSAKVKKHMVSGKIMSTGFGFIEFDSVETARRACQSLQGTVLDGHALKVEICHVKKDEQVSKKTGKVRNTTKLIVKNLAFEATKNELRQMFSPFGEIKRVRLPQRLTNHRGFAFVEFFTKEEARNALEALSNTHLYNRHLVLDHAKEDETFEELRARTAAQQNGLQSQGKLSKKRKLLV